MRSGVSPRTPRAAPVSVQTNRFGRIEKKSHVIIWPIVLAAALIGVWPAAATSPDEQLPNELNNDGNDDTNPINRVDLRAQYTSLPDAVTPDKVLGDRSRDRETLRDDLVFPQGPDQIQLRIDVPLVWSNVPTSDNPEGHGQFGLGDLLVQGSYSHALNTRWAVAVGVRTILPSASQDALGAGKWQIAPSVDIRASLPEIGVGSYASLTVRQFSSVAGDSSRRNIRNTSILPALNFALPKQWYALIGPNIQYNLNSQKWFVPLNATVGKKFGTKWTLSLEYNYGLVMNDPRYKQYVDFRIGYFY
jgi:hypothetical protein